MNLRYYIHSMPVSTDPADYDYFANQLSFGSVYGTLVSQFSKLGDIPYLAVSWSSQDSSKRWEFTLRDDIKFDNGDLITTKDVAKSLVRLGLIFRKRKSYSEFFEKLSGFNDIKSVDEIPSGIIIDGRKLVFKFDSSFPTVLDYLAGGLFGIVSSKNFNADGQWKDSKSLISSGIYSLKNFDDNKLTIVKRDGYLDNFGHKNKANSIEMSWGTKKGHYNLIDGTSVEKQTNGMVFFGEVYSGINYLHCFTWQQKNSFFYEHGNRVKFRDFIWSQLAKRSSLNSLTKSFIAGFDINPKVSDVDKVDLKDPLRLTLFIFKDHQLVPATREIINEFPSYFKENRDFSGQELRYHLEPTNNSFVSDCRFGGTSILLESPREDVKFMIQSKEGIRLPDPTGNLMKMIEEENFDYHKINQQIWDDAIVIPLMRYASGVWGESQFDFSQFNFSLNSMDFSWVGYK